MRRAHARHRCCSGERTLAHSMFRRLVSVWLNATFALGPFRMRCQVGLESRSMLAEAVTIRAAPIVRIVKLDGVVLPPAHATDLVGAGRSLVKRHESAAWARELAARRLARLAQEAIRNTHMLIVRVALAADRPKP